MTTVDPRDILCCQALYLVLNVIVCMKLRILCFIQQQEILEQQKPKATKPVPLPKPAVLTVLTKQVAQTTEQYGMAKPCLECCPLFFLVHSRNCSVTYCHLRIQTSTRASCDLLEIFAVDLSPTFLNFRLPHVLKYNNYLSVYFLVEKYYNHKYTKYYPLIYMLKLHTTGS